MAQAPSDSGYAVIITAIKDEASKSEVVREVVAIAKNVTLDQVRQRLRTIPWTLTRKATRQTAYRLAERLEKVGATVKVVPPREESQPSRIPQPPVPPREQRTPQSPVMFEGPNLPGSAAHSTGLPQSLLKAGSDAAPLELEPLTLGGILDRTFQICKNHFWSFLGILIVPWLLVFAIVLGIGLSAGLVGFATLQTVGKDASYAVIILFVIMAVVAAVLAMIVILYLAQGAMIHAVSQVYLGREFTVKSSYRFIWERALKFILTSVLLACVIGGLSISVVTVGIILFFLFKFVAGSGWWSAFTWLPLLLIPAYVIPKLLLFDKVVIIEDIAYMEALRRSWNLLTGKGEGSWPRAYWLRLVVLLNIVLLIHIGVSMVFGIPAAVLQMALPKSLTIVGTILGEAMRNVGSLVAGLFGSVGMVVFYYDVRNRKEGFDLRMAAAAQERVSPIEP